MDVVIDANILFAALIKKNDTSKLMFSDKLKLHAPKFIFDEFERFFSIANYLVERREFPFYRDAGNVKAFDHTVNHCLMGFSMGTPKVLKDWCSKCLSQEKSVVTSL